MTMQAEYTITEDDYLRANLYAGWNWRRTLRAVGICAAFLLVAAYLLSWDAAAIAGAFVAMAFWFAIFRYVILPFQARSQYRKYKLLQGRIVFTLENDAIHFEIDGAASTIAFEKLLKWSDTEGFFLLFLAPKLFYIIPKSIGAQGFDLSRLELELRQHLGPPVW